MVEDYSFDIVSCHSFGFGCAGSVALLSSIVSFILFDVEI